MTDDLHKTGKDDDIRININQRWERNYWTKKFGVSVNVLKTAVEKVGPVAANVQRHLKENP